LREPTPSNARKMEGAGWRAADIISIKDLAYIPPAPIIAGAIRGVRTAIGKLGRPEHTGPGLTSRRRLSEMVGAAGCEFKTILRSAVLPVGMVLSSLEIDNLYYSTSLTPMNGISALSEKIL